VDRPWAHGLERLLTERRLKKGDLSKLSGVRAGTISAVANSPAPPEIPTLLKLLDGFTAHDRQQNPEAPAVALWQFFVSDEQAAMLSEANAAKAKLLKKEQANTQLADLLARPDIVDALTRLVSAASNGQPVSQPTPSEPQASTEHPPAKHARGELQRKTKTA
jgi:transcriptional regulator with XRE-family HTH domain